MFDEGRRANIEHIERRLEQTENPRERSRLIDLTHTIAQESHVTRQDRQRLIDANKAGDQKAVETLQNRMKGNKD